MNCFRVVGLTTLILFSAAAVADEKGHDHGAPPEQLGEVSFSTSCGPAAQKHF